MGICLGMQIAVIEAARNLLGLKKADSTEFTKTKDPVIGIMTEWMKKNKTIKRSINGDMGGTMRLGAYDCLLKKKSKIFNIYKKNLFSSINNEDKRKKLMKAIDYTNIKYGRHALSIAQAGLKKKWNIRRQHSSKIDTACFDFLPIVRVA